MKTTLPPLLKPLSALLLLTACDTPAEKADRAYTNALDAQHQSTALQMQVADLRARIETLEASDKVDSKNIDTLFTSRDAIREIQKIDQKWNEESIDRLFENDKVLNVNSARPTRVVEDK